MSLPVILIIIALVLLFIGGILCDILVKKDKGKIGEKLIEEVLEQFEKKKYNIYGRTLKNVYIPKTDSSTSEIDVLYITSKGIFVIESKNYSGWIFGREQDRLWTVTLSSGKNGVTKNTFYNPIKQNNGHIEYLKDYLKKIYPDKCLEYFSVIVFSDRCTLKSVPDNSQSPVIHRYQLFDTIKQILESKKVILTNAQIDDIYKELKKLTDVSDDVKNAHIADIKGKYGK